MNSFPGNNPLSNLVMKSDQTFLSMLKHFSRTSRLMKRFDLKGYKKDTSMSWLMSPFK